MATTSLWRIKGYLGDVLLYASNPEKTKDPRVLLENTEIYNKGVMEDVIAYAAREEATNDRKFVSGINCNPDTAREEMIAVKKAFEKEGGTIAYHGYQSFAEGEVTPELAHSIGMQLAQKLWGDKYQVLVATHLDKENHIHNHFVINTVAFVDGLKFRRTKKDYLKMRQVSDELCRENGLSVVEKETKQGVSYVEWEAAKSGKPVFRNVIRSDIDIAIKMSLTEREFIEYMEAKGYVFKFRSEKGNLLKRPSLSPKGSDMFFRFDKLGENYNWEEIENRILENIKGYDPALIEDIHSSRKYRKENPPKTLAKGLVKLYYYYCYELGIFKKYDNLRHHASWTVQADVRRFDQLAAQSNMLQKYGIETMTDLHEYRSKLLSEKQELIKNRELLRAELRRALRAEASEEQILEIKKRISAHSDRLAEITKDVNNCISVEKRSVDIQQEVEKIYQNEPERKEITKDELSK